VATFLAENTQPFVSPQESKKEGGNIRFKPNAVAVPEVAVQLAPLSAYDDLLSAHESHGTITQEGGVA